MKNHNFLWVTDFPLFTTDEQTGALETVHHPFTAPNPEDLHMLNEFTDYASTTLEQLENLLKIRSLAYDLVLDGQEVGGGSIRIHDSKMQKKVLNILGLDTQNLQHMLDALESGCPPHGGIALGLDRLLAIICRAKSIRDLIAFPKSLDGKDLLSKAPVPITEAEKLLYHIEIMDEEKEKLLRAKLEHTTNEDDVEMESLENGEDAAAKVKG
jgi:aspartyl-tRNA synthetase